MKSRLNLIRRNALLLSVSILFVSSAIASLPPVGYKVTKDLPTQTIINVSYPVDITFTNNLKVTIPAITVSAKFLPPSHGATFTTTTNQCQNVAAGASCNYSGSFQATASGSDIMELQMHYGGKNVYLPPPHQTEAVSPAEAPTIVVGGISSDEYIFKISQDNGNTWDTVTKPITNTAEYRAIAQGKNRGAAVPGDISWSKNRGWFAALATNPPPSKNTAWLSQNIYSWDSFAINVSIPTAINRITTNYNDTKWLAVGNNNDDEKGIILEGANNPNSWTTLATLDNAALYGIACNSSKCLAVGEKGAGTTTGIIVDPTNPTAIKEIADSEVMTDIIWDATNGRWFAVGETADGEDPFILTSVDGENWTDIPIPFTTGTIPFLAHNNSGQLLVGSNIPLGLSYITTSTDAGQTWSSSRYIQGLTTGAVWYPPTQQWYLTIWNFASSSVISCDADLTSCSTKLTAQNTIFNGIAVSTTGATYNSSGLHLLHN